MAATRQEKREGDVFRQGVLLRGDIRMRAQNMESANSRNDARADTSEEEEVRCVWIPAA